MKPGALPAKLPAAALVTHFARSDRPAAVLAVRLLRRVGDYVGLHFLHPATACQVLFHGPRQLVAFALLGFQAGQLLEFHSLGLGLFRRRRRALAVGALVIAGIAVIRGVQLLPVVVLANVQIVLFYFFVTHVPTSLPSPR